VRRAEVADLDHRRQIAIWHLMPQLIGQPLEHILELGARRELNLVAGRRQRFDLCLDLRRDRRRRGGLSGRGRRRAANRRRG
jgi:hypothetical protein